MPAEPLVAEGINTVWALIVAFLIFFMQPGFALLEAGQVRAKNAGNVLMKNMTDWTLGVLSYFVIGFGLSAVVAALTSTSPLDIAGAFAYVSDSGQWVTWLVGAVFAMTAATIVSGAVAERMDFGAYVVVAAAMTAVIYPVATGLTWDGGLLAAGGIAGLVGAYMVGPRKGRFDANGDSQPIPGHSMLLAVLGTLILAFGWCGFNVGTSAIFNGSNELLGAQLGRVALNTTLGMSAGALAAMLVSNSRQGKPDPLWTANGLLAGFVAVTGAVPHVTWWGALILGGLGGAIVLPTYRFVVDELGIDDVCGVFPVHGAAGALGTVLIPVFGVEGGSWHFLGVDQLVMQFVGVAVLALWAVVGTVAAFALADALFGLRVTEQEEEMGLDEGEHGVSVYPEFTGDGGPEPTAVSADGGRVETDGGRPSPPTDGIDGGVDAPATGDDATNGGEAVEMVLAVVSREKVADVKTALAEVGAPSLTVTDVKGRGSQDAKTEQWRGEEYTVDLHEKAKIECVVADVPTKDVVNAIRDAAHTGEKGDGKVFVLPVSHAVQIRTGKEGADAV